MQININGTIVSNAVEFLNEAAWQVHHCQKSGLFSGRMLDQIEHVNDGEHGKLYASGNDGGIELTIIFTAKNIRDWMSQRNPNAD